MTFGSSVLSFTYPISRTRFYLPSTGSAAVSPAFDAAWEETGDADRIKMVTTRISSAMSDKSITTLITAGDALCRQYVSDALEAQTIDQAVTLYARANETLGTLDSTARAVVKVVSGDGGTVRGTLLSLADYSSASEFNTSNRNKAFIIGKGPTSVAAQAGDRIVLEIGFNHGAVISSAAINFGDDSSTDLLQDEVTTAANNPWLEFSQVLTFQAVTVKAPPPFQRRTHVISRR